MMFKVGDKVFHKSYGLGEIIQLDEKVLSGKKVLFYVVKVHELTLWVPVNDSKETSLRQPTSRRELEHLKAIFKEESRDFPSDRLERRNLLRTWLKDGAIESICQVVRDLTIYGKNNKMNDHDASILEHSSQLLLDEWQNAWALPSDEAEQELKELLLSAD
jgi:RNA polymerase-interacting CarD/CdnL/TRCF family regulator